MHSKDILFLLLLIYITSIPKTLTYFEKEYPKQGDTQITMTAPETD